MVTSQPTSGDSCHYCGNPVARSGLIFSHRRRSTEVKCSIRLCNACGDRVEYHLHIALSNRLLEPQTAVA